MSRRAGSVPGLGRVSTACAASSGSTAQPCSTAPTSGWRIEAASGERVPGDAPRRALERSTRTTTTSSRSPGQPVRERRPARARRLRRAELAASVELGELEAEAGGGRRRSAAANELRAALLSAVSHDLRTPISAIKASGHEPAVSDDVDWTPRGAAASSSDTIDEETDRLERARRRTSLDMSRLQTDALRDHCAAGRASSEVRARRRSAASASSDDSRRARRAGDASARARRSRLCSSARSRTSIAERDPFLAARRRRRA